jgi:hypothetical protein
MALPSSPRLIERINEAPDGKRRSQSRLLCRQFFHLLAQAPYSEYVRKCHANALACTIRIRREQAKSNLLAAENRLDLSW